MRYDRKNRTIGGRYAELQALALLRQYRQLGRRHPRRGAPALTPQTLSGEVAQFEERLGVALFRRVGRRLELTMVLADRPMPPGTV